MYMKCIHTYIHAYARIYIYTYMHLGWWGDKGLFGIVAMGWLLLVRALKLQVSFAKEPYTRDNILQKRPIIWRSLLIEATPYDKRNVCMCGMPRSSAWPWHVKVCLRVCCVVCRVWRDIFTGYMYIWIWRQEDKQANSEDRRPRCCNTLQHAATRYNTLWPPIDVLLVLVSWLYTTRSVMRPWWWATSLLVYLLASCIRQTRLESPHACVWRDVFIRETWLSHMVTQRTHTHTHTHTHTRTHTHTHTSVSNGYCNTSHHTAAHCNTLQHTTHRWLQSSICAQLQQLQEGPLPVRVHPIVETPNVLLNSKQWSAIYGCVMSHVWIFFMGYQRWVIARESL